MLVKANSGQPLAVTLSEKPLASIIIVKFELFFFNLFLNSSLKSVTDTTCLVLNREKFAKTMEQFPDLLMKICKAVAQSIDTWEKRLLKDQGDQCGESMGRLGVTLI